MSKERRRKEDTPLFKWRVALRERGPEDFGARSVASHMSLWADAETLEVRRTQEELAEELACSARCIRGHLATLEAAKFVSKRRTKRGNVYTLTVPKPEDPAGSNRKDLPEGQEDPAGSNRKILPVLEGATNRKNLPVTPTHDAPENRATCEGTDEQEDPSGSKLTNIVNRKDLPEGQEDPAGSTLVLRESGEPKKKRDLGGGSETGDFVGFSVWISEQVSRSGRRPLPIATVDALCMALAQYGRARAELYILRSLSSMADDPDSKFRRAILNVENIRKYIPPEEAAKPINDRSMTAEEYDRLVMEGYE